MCNFNFDGSSYFLISFPFIYHQVYLIVIAYKNLYVTKCLKAFYCIMIQT